MTLADKVTSTRLILAPLFFIIFFLPRFFPMLAPFGWTVPVLWILFLVSEFTDMLDGFLARKRGEVSDFGKFFDPFADTLTQITFFLCFVTEGIFPPLLFLIVIYREFGILFVRNLMLKKGVALGARLSGKIKTVTYIVAGALALLVSSITRLGLFEDYYRVFLLIANIIFALAIVFAVFSFFEYVLVYRKTSKTTVE